MKKILGLDLGTNSIGWALIDYDFDEKNGEILGMGSRIIPMSADILNEFGKGITKSKTAERTFYRSVRRLRQRHLLRRERLHRVLNILGFLPDHYSNEIDFENKLGKFRDNKEPKLAYINNDFIFKNSFNEMMQDFKESQPALLNRKNSKGEDSKIPYDWTIYYLRKKALEKAISKEELSWIILNFNQKRGYYQLRGEDEENTGVNEYVATLKIINISKGEEDKKNNKTWYRCELENGWIYSATFTDEPNWLKMEKEFLITEEIDENGEIKLDNNKKSVTYGKEKRKISLLPTFEEIDLMDKTHQDKYYKKIKIKTELSIDQSGKTVGEYIYNSLLKKPNQKIRGKLIRTIERKFYKKELTQILEKQIELQNQLFSDDKFNECVRELYRSNSSHQNILSKKNFVNLFLDDIIFYQRPLRSQKSKISRCRLEYRIHKINLKNEKGEPIKNSFEKDEAGNDIIVKEYLRVVPKSNPYYQEFRIWKWISDLVILNKEDDSNVTKEYLQNISDYEKLFEFLNNKKEIEEKQLLKYLLENNGISNIGKKKLLENLRWNYVQEKKYPCNETKALILSKLEKVKNISQDFLNNDIEYKLWHIIYSITDKTEFESALLKFAKKYNLDENSFVESFKKTPPFKSEYGAYSEKALKKLLSLMRIGKYWSFKNIDENTKTRIDKLLTGEYDENIKNRVRGKSINLTDKNHFQGLPEFLAKYIVYDNHSESIDADKWNSPNDLKNYLKEFKQHSLRNPIVEQVLTEALRVVLEIWEYYGKGRINYFDEIHIELGREMKLPNEDREKLTNKILENENTNLRIKLLLAQLKKDTNVTNVRAFSPMHQEILKIYEDGVLSKYSDEELKNEIIDGISIYKVSKSSNPTITELIKYKLWLEQKYQSPYTGKVIPLNKLFTTEYEIEHIIPQSLYFDDSFSNKVICETEVNKLKDKQLGYKFIKNHAGEKVDTGNGKFVEIFTQETYKDFVKTHYSNNRTKRNKLLMEDIPEKMIERQLNDTRYISKFITSILSNIVRSETNDDGVNSKNLIPVNGTITSILRQDWGLNDVWNSIILPRFERINQLLDTDIYTTKNKQGHIIPNVPLEISKGFSKKRIDHRHHALDALVVACATRDHINLLNNKFAKSDTERFDLQRKLRNYEKVKIKERNTNEIKTKNVPKEFIKPWVTFNIETINELEKIVVSFKQNIRIINKATNIYQRYENGLLIKVKQKGENWAIRKPMHKETVSGLVKLNWKKATKGKIFTATRKSLNPKFTQKILDSITDKSIQKILTNFLRTKDNNFEIAFSPEGIEELNKNIANYNNGKFHQPIYKVRISEEGSKFQLGRSGNKKSKYVETAQGTNLYYAIYENKEGNRNYETIPLNIVIERQKQGLTSIPDFNEKGDKLLFYLSPNDLVYLPNEEEIDNRINVNFHDLSSMQKKRLFNVNDFSSTCYFSPNRIAKAIIAKEIDLKFDIKTNKLTGSFDTKTASYEGKQIKDYCIKLKIDRLGKIRTI